MSFYPFLDRALPYYKKQIKEFVYEGYLIDLTDGETAIVKNLENVCEGSKERSFCFDC
jgi:hypothetical protein